MILIKSDIQLFLIAGPSRTLLVPIVLGVAGGLLLLVIVAVMVATCLCIRKRNNADVVSLGQCMQVKVQHH